MNGVEASRKARIGVELHKNFLDFIDRQASFEAFGKVAFKRFEITVGRVRGNGDNGSLSGVKFISCPKTGAQGRASGGQDELLNKRVLGHD